MKRARLARDGFAVIRSCVPVPVCEALRREGEAALRRARWSPTYRLRRLFPSSFGGVRSPLHRHVLPTPLTPAVRAALEHASAAARAQCKVPASSRVVELNFTCALPGAAAQEPHCDIPPTAEDGRCTVWIALQDVDATMGPTDVWPRSHTRARAYFEEQMARHARWEEQEQAKEDREQAEEGQAETNEGSVGTATVTGTQNNSKVDVDDDVDDDGGTDNERAEHTADDEDEDEDEEEAEFTRVVLAGGDDAALRLTLDCGDIALMDCRILHRGSANTSPAADRFLLNVTFVAEEEDASTGSSRAGEDGGEGGGAGGGAAGAASALEGAEEREAVGVANELDVHADVREAGYTLADFLPDDWQETTVRGERV
jgi:ectoine hydroxylase-related dioxygenase (phytanoyl-CoA dioxygenase family)